MPTKRLAPPPRSFAADAHDCIMVRIQSGPTAYKFVARDAPQWRSTPRIITRPPPSHAELGREARLAVHCRGSVRRRRGAAKHKRRKAANRQALLAFRSLDPLSRAPANLIAGDGTKNAFPRSEQRTGNKIEKNHLTGKSPYKSTHFRFLCAVRSCRPTGAYGRARRRPRRGPMPQISPRLLRLLAGRSKLRISTIIA